MCVQRKGERILVLIIIEKIIEFQLVLTKFSILHLVIVPNYTSLLPMNLLSTNFPQQYVVQARAYTFSILLTVSYSINLLD